MRTAPATATTAALCAHWPLPWLAALCGGLLAARRRRAGPRNGPSPAVAPPTLRPPQLWLPPGLGPAPHSAAALSSSHHQPARRGQLFRLSLRLGSCSTQRLSQDCPHSQPQPTSPPRRTCDSTSSAASTPQATTGRCGLSLALHCTLGTRPGSYFPQPPTNHSLLSPALSSRPLLPPSLPVQSRNRPPAAARWWPLTMSLALA